MRLVCLSDTHGLHEQVLLPAGDVLIHAGDMSHHGHLEEVARFLRWFGSVGDFRHRMLIAGNHDFAFERSHGLALDLVPRHVTYLEDSGAELDGVRFWGSPVTPRFMNWAFNRSDEQLQQHWDRIPGDVDVLVTHGPPRGILDRVRPHHLAVGCPRLEQAVRRVRPRVHVFGHIHEGRGQTERNGVRYVNASICDPAYTVTRAPQVLELP